LSPASIEQTSFTILNMDAAEITPVLAVVFAWLTPAVAVAALLWVARGRRTTGEGRDSR
jgi:hypothetical protein